MAIFALAALVLIAAPVPAKASLAGLYELHQMEMAGGLELKPDGHFRYALSYGAVDEEGAGDWTFDGKTVHLTSKPMPNEPTFDLVADKPAPKCTLSLAVDWGKFNWSSAPDVLAIYEGAPKALHFLQADEQGNVHLENCAVTTVFPLVPMFRIAGAPLNLSAATGHRLSLKFRPNDLGHIAFRAEPLRIEGSDLLMERYDAEIRFIRARP
jgi:hypothetical protein